MGRSSNDDRSDRYNPNNDAYWAAEANEADQRGDDDDMDDGPSAPRSASTVSQPPSPVALHFQDFDAEHDKDSPLVPQTPSSEGHRAGWRILDRTSHVLLALAHSVRIVEPYRLEREPRASEHRAWRESIEQALEACRERELAAAPYFEPLEAARERVDEAARTLKQHKEAHERVWNELSRRQIEECQEILSAAKRDLEEQMELLRRIPVEHVWEHDDWNKSTRTWTDAAKVLEPILQPLSDWRDAEQKSGYWRQKHVQTIFSKLGLPPLPSPPLVPDLISPGWKSLLRSQADAIVRSVREAGGGPALISWTPMVVMLGRFPRAIDPGEWRVEHFNLQADAIEEFTKRETGPVEEVRRTRDTDHVAVLLSLKPSVCALVLSEPGRDHGAVVTAEVIKVIVDQIIALAERLPDQVDFCALLGEIAWECLRCEFAGVSGLTLGVRWNSRGGLSLCGVGTESRRDKDEAIAAFRRAMAFTLVLPTPTPPGTAAWVERHAASESHAIRMRPKSVKRDASW
jgi:hypothetical protein